MNPSHIVTTTDPMTGSTIADVKGHPHVVEGDSSSDLTIYFESEASRRAYLDLPVEHPEQGLSVTLDNPTDDYTDAN